MVTSSNGSIFRVTGPLCGEFTGPRWIPLTKASDAELWCFLWSAPDKWSSKQSWGWWFETLSRSLWRHCNVSLKINQHLSMYWFGAIRQQAITWANADPDLCRNMASLGRIVDRRCWPRVSNIFCGATDWEISCGWYNFLCSVKCQMILFDDTG